MSNVKEITPDSPRATKRAPRLQGAQRRAEKEAEREQDLARAREILAHTDPSTWRTLDELREALKR